MDQSKDHIIDLGPELSGLENNLGEVQEQGGHVTADIAKTSKELDTIINDLSQILPQNMIVESSQGARAEDSDLKMLNDTISEVISEKNSFDVRLAPEDLIVGITAGIVASIIDIVFVGTPEIVKIYKGGENFDGSIFTSALRKVGNGNDQLSKMLKWLSDKCKVPYDISLKQGVANPNNHRLRNFAHDPLIGVLFATADILLGTATMVDNNGKLCILKNKNDYPVYEKYLSLLYYLGHLLSDVCTARGLPVPGFILTQFFTGDGKEDSIAKKAEQMYKDGYDLRHLGSMVTPIFVKNLIIEIYINFLRLPKYTSITSIAEKEIERNQEIIYKYKLRIVSDAVACSGNILKFFLPPTMGNITALNLPEWISVIQNTVVSLEYQLRDRTVEDVLTNRGSIDSMWQQLLRDYK